LVQAELHKYLGYELQEARRSGSRAMATGGMETGRRWEMELVAVVEGGRVRDAGDFRLKSALREIAESFDGQFILTGNQNLILANTSAEGKRRVNELLKKYQVSSDQLSG
jgi:sulfite reductase (NADPH) hemoprotein beta-component